MSEKAGDGEDAGVDRRVAGLPPDLRVQMRKLWYPEDWEQLSYDERRHLARWIVELIVSDVSEAMESEKFGVRGEEHKSRTVSRVDERGWHEINRIQDDALLAILAAKAESAERLAESGEPGMHVLSAMLSCELDRQPRGADP